MSEQSREKQRKYFQFNWTAFHVSAGIKFALVTFVMMLLTQVTEFDFLIILIAAFLAWMTDVPGSTKNRVSGMIAFAIAAIGLLWVAAAVFGNVLWFTIAIFIVAFLFTLPMALSQRGYMVGWTAILWFFSVAPMTRSADLVSFSWDVVIGVTAVVIITVVWPSGIGPYGQAQSSDPVDGGGVEDKKFVLVYSLTVAVVTAVAAFIGLQLLTAGVVWVINGAFFVLGPSTRQSWVHGIERAFAVVVGTISGLLLVQIIDLPLIVALLWGLFGFLALAALNAGYFVSIASYTTGMTMTWAVKGIDVGSLNVTERIIAEALAIGLALAATVFLNWWSNHRQIDTFVGAELAT